MIFKIAALVILLYAVYLLYRIAFPKQPVERDNSVPERKTVHTSGVVGKSRFVLPDRSQPLQTPANTAISEASEEKQIMFAPESENDGSGIIPPEKLDEVFEDEINPDDLDIDDDNSDDEINLEAEEEFEQRNRVEGQSAMLAEGLNFKLLPIC